MEKDEKLTPKDEVVEAAEKEQAPAQEEPAVEAPAPLLGRAAFLARYKGLHPDLEEDPADDDLFDFAGKRMDEGDEWRGKYDKLNGSNEKLASVVSEDPRFAQLIGMVAGGESPMYAIGKTFGNLADELDEKGLEDLRAGQQEYNERHNQRQTNFGNYENKLKEFGTAHGLTEEQLSVVNEQIMDMAEAFFDFDIPVELMEAVWNNSPEKKAEAEAEKESEVEAAKLAGKNEAIDEIKSKKVSAAPLPDLGGMKSSSKAPVSKAPVRKEDAYVDILADSEKIS